MRARYPVFNDADGNPDGNAWQHLTEAEPLARGRLKSDAGVEESFIVVEDDGSLTYDETLVEIDVYDD